MLHRETKLTVYSRLRAYAWLLELGYAGLVMTAISAAILAGAWTFEYFGVKPCPLCLDERVPYYLAIPAGLIAAWVARPAPKFAALILAVFCLAFLYNSGLAFYHSGVEWHFWKGPQTCSGESVELTHSLANALKHLNPIRCDEASLRILGLSLAGYNCLISAAISVFLFVSLRQWVKSAA